MRPKNAHKAKRHNVFCRYFLGPWLGPLKTNTSHYIRFLRWPKKQLQGPPWREKTIRNYPDMIARVLSLRRKSDSDEAVVMLSGRLFQGVGPAEVNDRSPTMTRRDGRTMSWLEVDERRRLWDEMTATRLNVSDGYGNAVPCRAR